MSGRQKQGGGAQGTRWVPDPSRDAVTVLDRNLNVLDWNEQAEALHGWTAGEAIGQNSNELVPSATPWLQAHRRRQLYRTGRYAGTSLVIVKNGDIVPIEAVCVAVGREFFNVMRRVDVRNLPQFARDSSVIPITRESYRRADLDVGLPSVATMTRDIQVGKRLQRARESAGLTKYQLAKLAGVREAQIRVWERGVHVPSYTNVERLVPHIGGTPDDYLSTRRKRGK